MIEVKNISKNFGPFQAVNNISFNIEKGEIVGLLGPNGAGKTTTMRMITGYYKPSLGTITVDGLNIENKAQDIQRKIGYLPESASSYTDMLVSDFLIFSAEARGLIGNEIAQGIERSVEATKLHKFFYRPISELSKGFKQRVGLASALIHDPEILILDEPTAGLDPNQILEIQKLIVDLSTDKTIILSTHILKEVEATCQRAIIINEGNMVMDNSLDQIQKMKEGATQFTVVLKNKIDNALDTFTSNFQSTNDVIDLVESNESETKFMITSSSDSAEKIFKLAVDNSWILKELTPQKQSLEEVFRTLTTKGAV